MERHRKEIVYEGEVYDLRHLNHTNWSFSLSCGSQIDAFVQFRSHCYTDEQVTAGREPLEIPDMDGNPRFFCPKRHALSLNLKQWFFAWSSDPCFLQLTKRGRQHWIVVETSQGEKVKVVFAITPNSKDPRGVMIIIKTVHAYDRPTSRPPTKLTKDYLPFSILLKGVAWARKAPTARKDRYEDI